MNQLESTALTAIHMDSHMAGTRLAYHRICKTALIIRAASTLMFFGYLWFGVELLQPTNEHDNTHGNPLFIFRALIIKFNITRSSYHMTPKYIYIERVSGHGFGPEWYLI
jgi:hypothetical protein